MILFDMSKHNLTCTGSTNRTNAGRVRRVPGTPQLGAALTNEGYDGYFIAQPLGSISDFSYTGNDIMRQCLWRDGFCTSADDNVTVTTKPLPIKIGIKRTGPGSGKSLKIMAGTEIARLQAVIDNTPLGTVEYRWFIFKADKDYSIPVQTCSVDNGDIQVKLPPVDIYALQRGGAGRHELITKIFQIDLTCEPQTSVDVKFDGDIMTGHSDVLKNTVSLT